MFHSIKLLAHNAVSGRFHFQPHVTKCSQILGILKTFIKLYSGFMYKMYI